MEEIQDIKKKIQHLEYGDIKELKDKFCNMEISLNQNNLLTELCTKSNEKMSETLDSVKDTMIAMSKSIEQNNKASEELSDSVKSLGNQVNKLDNKMEEKFIEVDNKINNSDKEVNKKINEIDNKSKFDILDYLKKNWITIAVSAGIISYLLLQ